MKYKKRNVLALERSALSTMGNEDEAYLTQEDEEEEEENELWTEKFSPKTMVWLKQFLYFLIANGNFERNELYAA